MSVPRDIFGMLDVEAKVTIKSSSSNADERPISLGHFEVRLVNDLEMEPIIFSWPRCDGKNSASNIIEAWLFVACHDLKLASEQSASHGEVELTVGEKCTATVRWPVGGAVGVITMTFAGPLTIADAVETARQKMKTVAAKWSGRGPVWGIQLPHPQREQPWDGEPDWVPRFRAMHAEARNALPTVRINPL